MNPNEDAFLMFRFYGAKPELWNLKWNLGDPGLLVYWEPKMKTSRPTKSSLAVVAIVTLALPCVSFAQEVNPPEEAYEAPKKEYSPFVDDHFPTRVLWGDTHVHTSYSTDAGMTGTTLGPDEAYRFARREAVTSNLGIEMPDDVAMTVQDRAYTSPIWYTPSN